MKNLTLTLIITLAAFSDVFGQDRTTMSADQTLRSNARVNPSTLGMELNIPLASYPGRGAGVSVGISYSSKVWRMEKVDRVPAINTTICRDLSVPRFAELSASGWTTDTSVPYVEYVGLDNVFDYDGKPVDTANALCVYDPFPNGYKHVRRIVVRMPGGGSHELWASSDLIVNQNVSTYNPANVSWNGTFYSADGSNLIYQQDSSTSTYRLLLPDGSRMTFGSSLETLVSGITERTIRKATGTIDVNGNKITYHEPTSGYPNGYITDTMGRVISVPLGLSAPEEPTDEEEPQEYSVPGLTGGSAITYNFHWRELDDVLNNTSDVLCYKAPGYPYPNSPQPPTEACKLFNSIYNSLVYEDVNLGEFNPVVLDQIDLPNGSNYKFRYDKYGRIVKIEYPTGAAETFNYSQIPSLMPSPQGTDISDQVNYGVTHREVVESTGATPIEWDYNATRNASPAWYKVRTDSPDGTWTENYLTQGLFPAQILYGFDTPSAGMPYEQRSYDSNNNLMSKSITTFEVTGTDQKSHPRTTKVESIIYDPVASTSLSSSVTTGYATIDSIDDPLLSTSSNQYGFTTTLGSLGSLERTTETDYLVDSNYAVRNLRSLPTETRVKDPGGNVKAKTHIYYDTDGGQSLLDESESTYWENPSSTYRGLVTKTRSWYDISNNLYIDTQVQYDMMGNRRKSWDGLGNLSQIEYSSTYDYSYPTKTYTPIPDSSGTHGLNDELETTTTYDYNTGLTLTVTDPNGAVTEMEYDDSLLRPTRVIAASGTAIESETITEYGAGTSAATRWVKVKSQIDTTTWKETLTWTDGLGRTIRNQSIDSESGDVFALTCYDSMGRKSKFSNPFRGYSSQTCSTTSGIDWTTYTFDSAGRPWKVTTPDAAVVETTYGLAATNSYLLGSVVTVEDQAGKLRRSVTNALGQLKRVDEPNDSNVLGLITSPNQYTSYAYDYLNNLTTVTQGAQNRTFIYDALSRMKEATNPESGAIKYSYDANGNLKVRWDARGIKTIYDYDSLNRIRKRCYKDVGTSTLGYTTCTSASGESAEPNTPDVAYYYDNLTNAKGKPVKVSSSASTTEYTNFDILGRVTASKQTTNGVTYGNGSTDSLMTYSYNLGGALIEQQYPSGRVVRSELDGSGDLSKVSSKKVSTAIYKTYANDFTYNVAGAVSSLRLGNGRFESTQFNSRFQPTQIALGYSEGNSGVLRLDYSYGEWNGGSIDETKNNGNIVQQDITVPTVGGSSGFTATQKYYYDSLNRIDDAAETISSTQTWRQDFIYDRYGNRNFNRTNTSMPTSFSNSAFADPTISTSSNRITSSGWTYDAAGNTLTDAAGQSYVYDAENKQVAASNGSGQLGEYSYDAHGKRVSKRVPMSDEITIFVYDIMGKQIAEYSTVVQSGTNAKVSYLTTDHLGSPRVNTDSYGAVTARHDYHPFGESISTGRSTHLEYTSDTVRKRFTGYERDDESGNDFAQARSYLSYLGRFNQCDPELLSKEHLANPQRWNGYIYVLENPINLVDPDGRKPKIVIDVFVSMMEVTPDSKAAWKKIVKDAKKQGVKINVFFESNRTATGQRFFQSLTTPNRAVVFVGHSLGKNKRVVDDANNGRGSMRGKGIGLYFFDVPVVSKEGKEDLVEGQPGGITLTDVNIKAKVLAVFACDYGKTFDGATMDKGSTFIVSDPGEDGVGTNTHNIENAAQKLVINLANGGSGKSAARAAQKAYNENPYNANFDGDRIFYTEY